MTLIRHWRAPIVMGLIVAAFLVFSPNISAAASDDAEFVFQVYQELENNYYNPKAISYPPLLNFALRGVEVLLRSRNIEFNFEAIENSATDEEAKAQFTKELTRAEQLGVNAGFGPNDFAFIASRALMSSLHSSHTGFLTPEAYKKFLQEMRRDGTMVGIGIYIGRLDGDFVYIKEIIEGSPAQKAGLEKFDRLVTIDGKSLANSTSEVAKQIGGPVGSAMVITIERGGVRKDFKIVREEITLTVFTGNMLASGDKQFGYLKAFGFKPGLADKISQYIKGHPEADGWIIDLRGNPGGYVNELIAVIQNFLPPKTEICAIQDRNSRRSQRTNANYIQLTSKPAVVLIDEGTGSAAEIMTAALKDHGRAKVAGVKSSGSVEIATIRPLSREAAMMVALLQVFSPNGNLLEKNGVTPDVEIKLTKEDVLAKKDSQLEKAVEILKSQ